ncbi:MAG: hypothetical protein KA791_02640 [Flavobacteriales bacterium]|nr:hypothetical protein [Flavobacteriales bacterium]
MHHAPFPVYLRLTGGYSLYRIESETSFTEVQHVGSRYLAHRISAITWPERLRIADMLMNRDGSLARSTPEEFDHWLNEATRG